MGHILSRGNSLDSVVHFCTRQAAGVYDMSFKVFNLYQKSNGEATDWFKGVVIGWSNHFICD